MNIEQEVDQLFNTTEIAWVLGVNTNVMSNWKARGLFPAIPYAIVKGMKLYTAEQVLRLAKERKVDLSAVRSRFLAMHDRLEALE